jgi:hypothetical protein
MAGATCSTTCSIGSTCQGNQCYCRTWGGANAVCDPVFEYCAQDAACISDGLCWNPMTKEVSVCGGQTIDHCCFCGATNLQTGCYALATSCPAGCVDVFREF